MGFMKRKKQPQLFRDASIDPTKEQARNNAAMKKPTRSTKKKGN